MKTLKDHIENVVEDIPRNDERLMLEMAQIGKFDKNKLTIYVRSDDAGNIPHFHIVDTPTLGARFHTCVEIKRNRYFHHTGKEDDLSLKQRKMLNMFLKEPHRNKSFSNWSWLLQLWNDGNNSKMEVDELQDQPDYTTIEDNK